MGSRRNSTAYNIVAWLLTTLATVLTLVMLLGLLKQTRVGS
jgi:hypothetical protein